MQSENNLFLSQEELDKIGCNLPDDYSQKTIITRTLNKSGSYRIDCKYEKSENGYLYISQTVIQNITCFHTFINAKLDAIVNDIVFEFYGLTLIEIPTTKKFGKESKIYVLVNNKNGPVGNIIRMRYNKVYFSTAIVGIYFNHEDPFISLVENIDKRIQKKRKMAHNAFNPAWILSQFLQLRSIRHEIRSLTHARTTPTDVIQVKKLFN